MTRFSPVHHTFAPLADGKQIRRSLALAFQPWRWKDGPEQTALREALENDFNGSAHLFGSGREALLAILRSLMFQKDEEVIVQGYTCVVVPNAVIAAGMVPVFADIERDTLNLDLAEVEKLITPKTRAIVCQHTFGIPAYAQRLRDLCDRHSLILIEDCAHVMPDTKGPAEIGRYGDVLFFSFGRDKAISGVSGGAAVCRRKDICQDLERMSKEAKAHGILVIKRLLQYPVLYAVAKPWYGLGIGKALLATFGKLRMLEPITTRKEKEGVMDATIHRMPNACAILALDQFRRRREINDHRRMLTAFYFEEAIKRGWPDRRSPQGEGGPMLLGVTSDLPLQKFPLFVNGAEKIRRRLKKKNIHLHDGWTGCVICPPGTDTESVGYKDGQDPDAEFAGQSILSLPTHPDMSLAQAKKLVDTLDRLL